ncbi:peptidylprolyl isomerase [Dactylosporangium salmoneum]|uniref:Peptidylprolyl isomerase n=1 Tax=Dactylosporangium salmoneum TaxID=53361 RepID=A0ABP5T3T3_9ACTN
MNSRRYGALIAAVGLLLLAGCSNVEVPTAPQRARQIAAPGAAGAGKPSAGATGSTADAGPVACRFIAPSANQVPAVKAAAKDVGVPPATPSKSTRATMRITTNQGAIVVQMDARKAPCSVHSFAFLAGKHFFDNTKCHRMTTESIFVLQCGDPSATGYGGPAYSYHTEDPGSGYVRGTVAIANAGDPDTNGSQFFINYKDNTQVPPDYTMLGTVTSGMDVVDKIAAGGVNPTDASSPGDGAPKIDVVLQQVTVGYDD